MTTAFAIEILKGSSSMDSKIPILEFCGVSLANPNTGQVTQLNEFGEQVVSSRDRILDLIERRIEVSFQLWLDADHDVFCRVRWIGPFLANEYGFNGLHHHRLDQASAAVWCGLWASLDSLHAFVLDRTGSTEDLDWVQILLTGAEPTERPDVLIRNEAGGRYERLKP